MSSKNTKNTKCILDSIAVQYKQSKPLRNIILNQISDMVSTDQVSISTKSELISPISQNLPELSLPEVGEKVRWVFFSLLTEVRTTKHKVTRHENCWQHRQHASGTKKIKLRNHEEILPT